ncbi:hypothetical protein [Phormidesmis priestleyi]|nr:hypothetical protein [Phormidesmis priestleyi]
MASHNAIVVWARCDVNTGNNSIEDLIFNTRLWMQPLYTIREAIEP